MGWSALRSLLLVGAVLGTPAAAAAEPPGYAVLGPPPWLGVTMDSGGDLGVAVQHVVRSSPADKAGIKSGDRIVSVDGVAVSAPQQVTRTVQAHKIGESVVVGIERRGAAVSATVLLSARPAGDDILRMDLVGAPAPAFTNVTPLAGAPSSLAQLRGRVVVVDFWASWCGPCRMIAPKLGTLKDRFGAQGLSVVGVTTDEAEKAALFAERHQMRYPSVVDKDGDTSKAYGIMNLPTLLLVDKKGVVRDVIIGFDPSPGGDQKLEDGIKKLLAER